MRLGLIKDVRTLQPVREVGTLRTWKAIAP